MEQLRFANVIAMHPWRPEAAHIRGMLQVAAAGVVDGKGGGCEVDVLCSGVGGV